MPPARPIARADGSIVNVGQPSDEALGAAGFDAHAHLKDVDDRRANTAEIANAFSVPLDAVDASSPVPGIAPAARTENRPSITPAQIVSGIPILAEFMHAFGVYDLSPEQVDSLGKATLWSIGLLGSDAVIRLARNLARR